MNRTLIYYELYRNKTENSIISNLTYAKINHQYLVSLDYRIESSKILQQTVKDMKDALK